MSLLTSLIPAPYQLLARILLYVALVAALVGWGYVKGVSHADHNADIKIAAMQKAWGAERLQVASVGAKAAQHTADVVIKQTAINQESDHAAQTYASALDARIAHDGLRITAQCLASGSDVPAVPNAAGPLADAPAQSEPIVAERSAAEIQANAARDAQQLAELIDNILKQSEVPTNP